MKTPQKKKAEGGATPTASVKHLNAHNTTAPNQRAIVLTALQTGGKNTIELQHEYGVMAPAARIAELRKTHKIDSVFVNARTPDGVLHLRVAQYVLVPGEGA